MACVQFGPWQSMLCFDLGLADGFWRSSYGNEKPAADENAYDCYGNNVEVVMDSLPFQEKAEPYPGFLQAVKFTMFKNYEKYRPVSTGPL